MRARTEPEPVVDSRASARRKGADLRVDIHNHAAPEALLELFRAEQAFGVRGVVRHLGGGPE
jgi:hypothetical protein